MRKISGLLKSLKHKPFLAGSLLFLLAYTIMLVLTAVSHGFRVFIWQDIAGIGFMTVLWGIHHYHPLDKTCAVFSVVIFSWIQIEIAMWALGTKAGFQNYFFATLATAFFLTFSTKTERTTLISAFIEIGSLFLYLMSIIHGESEQPLYSVPERDLFFTNIINSFISLLAITFFADSYRYRLRTSVISLRHAADFDELTKLLNRRGIRPYFDLLQHEWEEREIPYAVAIMDIDDFKEINDQWGHNEGDKVLVEIAALLGKFTNDSTWVCRWGGEEFLIVSQLKESKTTNMNILNIILGEIRKISIPVENDKIQVSVTIGCAFSEQDMMIHELINKADNALYRGKSNGKNQMIIAE